MTSRSRKGTGKTGKRALVGTDLATRPQVKDGDPRIITSGVSDVDLRGAVATVKYGHDPYAARSLIAYFHERLKEGEKYNEQILGELLEYAFGKIVDDNWSADHAFGLRRKRGRYDRKDTTERDVRAAALVELLMRSDKTLSFAKSEAADRHFPDGCGGRAIDAAWQKYRDVLRSAPKEFLEDLKAEETRPYRAI